MKEKRIYSTVTVQHEMLSNMTFDVNFKVLMLDLDKILKQIGKSDYCFFVDFIKTNDGTLTKVHDGGKTYVEEADDIETKIYHESTSIFQVDKDYNLYFSIDENVFCFLDER